MPVTALTLGVDTHKDVHVAAALDQLGRRLGVASFPTDDAHHAVLWDWASGFGPLAQVVEGTGSFGYRLAQYLGGRGVSVFEVNRPNRTARRRRGKSDPVDAENVARAVLSGDATAIPKTRTGPAGQLRRRRSVCGINRPRRKQRRLGCPGATLAVPRRRGTRQRRPHRDARTSDRARAACPARHRSYLCCPTTGHRRDNPDRLANEAAFAAVCGVSPVEHSSGKTQRHRLNRGGDRAANSALWTIANNWLMHDPRTRAYAGRRTATGLSRKEILRLLKRYIARQVYSEIRRALTAPKIDSAKILT